MNFAWCGQSCGSTSRAFIHEDIYDAVLARIEEEAQRFQPGDPSNEATSMGAIISAKQHERIVGFIDRAQADGARLICGGGPPAAQALARGLHPKPQVLDAVTPALAIATEK